MRCGIYVRVSTDDQRDNGYSIDSQLRMIKAPYGYTRNAETGHLEVETNFRKYIEIYLEM